MTEFINTTTATTATTEASSQSVSYVNANEYYDDNDDDEDVTSSTTAAIDTGEINIDGYDMTRASVTDRALHFAMVCQDNELFRGLRLGETQSVSQSSQIAIQ